MVQRFCRIAAILFTLSFLAVPLVSTSAQAATITVNPVWHPPIQLVSKGPDIRTAQAEIWVTSNVQYWLASFTCTVTATALPTIPTVVWSQGVWGHIDNDFTAVQLPKVSDPPSAYVGGKFTFTATKLDPSTAVGQNGVTQTQLLATLTYTIPALTAGATSPFTCTSMFLDRNGKSVATATVKAPASLQILTGYALKGTVALAGKTTSAGVTVTCSNPNDPLLQPVTTSMTGAFSFTSLRAAGIYSCNYGSLANMYLQATTSVNVSIQGVTLPPVTLKGGDTDKSNAIDSTDLAALTSHFGATGALATAANGDINGDTKIDNTDLAILSSNYTRTAPNDGRHLLVGISRTSSPLYNDRIWLGNAQSNAVISYGGTATAKAYWPVLSPDGTKIAYIQEVAAGTFDPITGFVTKLPRYALFVGAAAGTTGTQITPTNWVYDAFAPAWSLDGSKIAFACGQNTGALSTTQWTQNPTQVINGVIGLCVIDAGGTNLSVVAPVAASIQRPTWVSNSQIVAADSNSGVLNQYDLGNGTVDPLAGMTCCNSSPVFKDGKLFYIHFEIVGSVTTLRVIDYADSSIALNPTLVPTFVDRTGAVPATGYHTDVADNSAFAPIGNINLICSYDVAPVGMDFVVDNCDGSYNFFTVDLSSGAPAWAARPDKVVIDGAVDQPSAGADPYANWIRAVSNSVNFVP